jgi:tripartite-type tricarboxylate transporter receptor subunit TctC
MTRMFVIAELCLFTVFSSLSPVSEAWPERPIQFIVTYGAGGGADVAARIICASLSKELGGSSYFFVLDLMDTAGLELKLVPYNGHADHVNAVLGSFADMTESAPATVASMMRAKKLMPLAMFTKKRDPVWRARYGTAKRTSSEPACP